MNDESPEHRREAPDPHVDEPTGASERPEAVEQVETIVAEDVVRAVEAARRRDAQAPERTRGRSVQWVRPTDLIARHSGTLAGRGIDFQAELARRTRASMATRARSLSNRARRLPPLSAFGRASTGQAGPTRSGVGMS